MNQAVFVFVVFVDAVVYLMPLVLVLVVGSEMLDRPVKPSCDLLSVVAAMIAGRECRQLTTYTYFLLELLGA